MKMFGFHGSVTEEELGIPLLVAGCITVWRMTSWQS